MVRVQLLPNTQDFYYLGMEDCSFPIRIILRNVRNSGTLFVGYDREHPGVPREEEPEEETYLYKTTFAEDKMITMKNKSRKEVSRIFLSFFAGEQLAMFNLKVDSIWYEGIDQVTKELSLFVLKREKSPDVRGSSAVAERSSHENLSASKFAKNLPAVHETLSAEKLPKNPFAKRAQTEGT